jgi:hypothetical protein
MRTTDRFIEDLAFGRYFGDFISDPGKQVHSRVFRTEAVVHVYYVVQDGFSIFSCEKEHVTDRWLGEVLDYMYLQSNDCVEVTLHAVAREADLPVKP